MAASPALRRGRVVGAAAFLAGACVWTFVSAAVSGGDPLPTAAVIAASAAALVLAVPVGRRAPWIVPALVVGSAAVVAVVARTEILSSRPQHGPFGYANATGAFYLQATVAALMLAAAARTSVGRWAGGSAAAACAGITIAAGSAAAIGLLVLPVAGLVLSTMRRGRTAVVALAIMFAVALLGTTAAGVLGDEPAGRTVVDERRRALWELAVTAIGENPLTGMGPGGFAEAASGARVDPDARWAHHGFLQLGAETGILGMGLVVLAFAWMFASFSEVNGPTALAVLGTAALAVFGIGASVDYLMHFPAIPVTAAALAGTASRDFDV